MIAAEGRGLSEEGGRSALLPRPVARNTPFGFRLSDSGRMAHKRREFAGRGCERHNVRMGRHDRPWAVRTLFNGSAELRFRRCRAGTVSHAQQAMMLSI